MGGRGRCALGRCRTLGKSNGRDKTITTASQGFNEARIVGGVAEGLSDFVDGRAEGVLEVDDRVFAPDTELKIFPGDDLAGVLEEHREHLEGLALNFDSLASLPQLSGLQISLKETEKDPR